MVRLPHRIWSLRVLGQCFGRNPGMQNCVLSPDVAQSTFSYSPISLILLTSSEGLTYVADLTMPGSMRNLGYVHPYFRLLWPPCLFDPTYLAWFCVCLCVYACSLTQCALWTLTVHSETPITAALSLQPACNLMDFLLFWAQCSLLCLRACSIWGPFYTANSSTQKQKHVALNGPCKGRWSSELTGRQAITSCDLDWKYACHLPHVWWTELYRSVGVNVYN